MQKIFPLILLAATACSGYEADLDAVRLQLTDPDSAEFDAVGKKDDVTCGFVNAKNRMGGYVGFRAFIVISGRAEIEPALGEFATRFPSVCPTSTSKRYIDLLAGQVSAYESITKGQVSVPEED
jgi:hypothetical protein